MAPGTHEARPVLDAGYRPPLVITVHGIRTEERGGWQDVFAAMLRNRGIVCHKHQYGYYDLGQFLSGDQEKLVDEFANGYWEAIHAHRQQVDLGDFRRRPSIVCHSLGTQILGRALRKFEEIRFDKVILCGSILPIDFDWPRFVHRDQVNSIRNDAGGKDWVTGLAELVKRGKAGDSGRVGFSTRAPYLDNRFFEDHDHGTFFLPPHMNGWLSYLEREPVPLEISQGADAVLRTHPDFVERPCRQLDDLERGRERPSGKFGMPEGLGIAWMHVNSDIYTLLNDRAEFEMRGYLCAVPVESASYEELLAGRLWKDLTADEVLNYGRDEVLDLCVPAMVVDSRIPGGGGDVGSVALKTLCGGLVWKLTRYARDQGVAFDRILLVAGTERARRICRILTRNASGQPESRPKVDPEGSSLFELRLSAPLPPGAEDVAPGIGNLKRISDEHLVRLQQGRPARRSGQRA